MLIPAEAVRLGCDGATTFYLVSDFSAYLRCAPLQRFALEDDKW
jgi:hypothetical protein